jgi:regulator of sigma E protease
VTLEHIGTQIVSKLGHFGHSFLAFILILMPLVVFHELGHFWFARLFGVRADIFSVGFGPKIFSWIRGETEWRLSWIPLGGYVKLLGQDDTVELSAEELKRSLNTQAPWKRFLVYFGGPLFNFILAGFLFGLVMFVGEEKVSNIVGRVVKDSPAFQAGFQVGDNITQVDHTPVEDFDQVDQIIAKHPGERLSFELMRGQRPVKIEAHMGQTQAYHQTGEFGATGILEGLSPYPRAAVVGVSDAQSVAAKAGFVTGDEIQEVGPEQGPLVAVDSFEQLEGLAPGLWNFKVKTGEATKNVHLALEHGQSLQDLGLYSSELFIQKVLPDSAAEKAGLKLSDRIFAINGISLESFSDLKKAVGNYGQTHEPLQVGVERLQTGRFTVSIVPNATTVRDLALKEVPQYTLGVMPMVVFAMPAMHHVRQLNPFIFIPQGFVKMASFTAKNFAMFKKMLLGEASLGGIGGPVMIGKMAGESLSRGLAAFLSSMALFSVGLGVLNILPIPLLDGGHIALMFVELVRRKPLSTKHFEIAQMAGFAFVVSLMLIAFRNDFLRIFQ